MLSFDFLFERRCLSQLPPKSLERLAHCPAHVVPRRIRGHVSPRLFTPLYTLPGGLVELVGTRDIAAHHLWALVMCRGRALGESRPVDFITPRLWSP